MSTGTTISSRRRNGSRTRARARAGRRGRRRVGHRAAARALRRRDRVRLGRRDARRADRRLRRDPHPLGDEADRRADRARRAPAGDRARRGRRRQRRRRRGDAARASSSRTRPQSNVVTAAEHTIALLLALARNIPQAHASLTAGRWERSKFSGVELYDKTLGILGFGRIGQLVAARARGLRDAA